MTKQLIDILLKEIEELQQKKFSVLAERQHHIKGMVDKVQELKKRNQ